jgi:hypothetical protein
MTTVTLSREQRDALRYHAWPCDAGHELDNFVDAGDEASAKAAWSQIQVAMRLVDQIGWEPRADVLQECFDLELDEELGDYLWHIRDRLQIIIRDDLRGLNSGAIAEDRQALASVEHILEAYHAICGPWPEPAVA